jgi:hypothetical protein
MRTRAVDKGQTQCVELNERGAKIAISQHPRRAVPFPLDTELYKWRHLIDNFFCRCRLIYPKQVTKISPMVAIGYRQLKTFIVTGGATLAWLGEVTGGEKHAC